MIVKNTSFTTSFNANKINQNKAEYNLKFTDCFKTAFL